jgi:hypothetical protein
MNFGKVLAILLCIVFAAGLVMAISGASVAETKRPRWVGNTPGNATTEGGNISQVNLSATTLTDRWSAFYGNVSGGIVLSDNDNASAYVYQWSTAANTSGGAVCASTNSSYIFTSLIGTNDSALNTAWGFGVASDNVTKTFTDSATCNLNFSQGGVATSARVNHTTGSFWTCAMNDNRSTAKSSFAFCTNISSTGVNFKGNASQYEIMVPTVFGSGTETYYFYLQLS